MRIAAPECRCRRSDLMMIGPGGRLTCRPAVSPFRKSRPSSSARLSVAAQDPWRSIDSVSGPSSNPQCELTMASCDRHLNAKKSECGRDRPDRAGILPNGCLPLRPVTAIFHRRARSIGTAITLSPGPVAVKGWA